MAITRQEALKLLNGMLLQIGDIALADVSLKVAMICVWGVYSDRIENALFLCAQQGVRLTEDELLAMASFWRMTWQLGVKSKQAKCPLCEGPMPADDAELCSCFQPLRVGQYIDYSVPGAIKEIAAARPGVWRNLYAEAFECKTCSRIQDITLGYIADKLNQGRYWKTPQYCKKCAHEHYQKTRQPGQASRLAQPSPSSTGASDMQEMHDNMAFLELLPPPAES